MSTENTLQTILEKLEVLQSRQLALLETQTVLYKKVEEYGKQSLKMLAVCQKGYTNILKAQEYTCEQFDDCREDFQDMSNSVSNIGWGC